MVKKRLEYLKIHPNDMTAVALAPLCAGKKCIIDGREIILKEDVMQGHKFALQDIKAGDKVIKYGSPIGIAKEDIDEGQWIHTHNLKTGLGNLLEYTYNKVTTDIEPTEDVKFTGYRRADGKVGVRNEIWIIPTVGCVNNVAQAIERQAQQYLDGSVEAICAFPHPYGCSQMGDDQEYTRTILGDLIRHPNAGGVLVLGLGCENSNIGVMKNYIGDYDEKRIRFLSAQDTDDEIGDSLEIIKDLVDTVKEDKREPISADELIIGLKCGGSDGLSGITANPTVGKFSDILISKGGTTMLTEVPEMFGAETLLMNRCESEEVFHETVGLINDFKNYFKSHHQTIYENPSPGNKKGGISTLEDKSLGCVQKSGSSAVRGVLSYGSAVQKKGLNLLSAPGNDLVAATALAASGAQIVLFTTGRGTPFASPVPTVKIATNTPLAEKKKNWIGFSCGRIVQGETIDDTAQKLFDYVIRVASGEQVKSEKNGFHDMAIFKRGVTL
mgnify:FL=1